MARKLNISYKSAIFLLAMSFVIVGCADNRGFETKRLKTPAIFDQKPGGDEQTETRPREFAGPVLTEEEIVERTDQAVESNTEKISDSTFVYNEGGNETQVTPSEIEEKKQDLREKAITTMNLPADQQILKGLSLSVIEATAGERISLNIKGVVKVDGALDFFTGDLILTQSGEKISGKISMVQWISNRTDILTEISGYCNGAAEALCEKVSVTVQMSRNQVDQVFVVQYAEGNEGLEIVASSTGLLSFDQASQSTPAVEEEATEEENKDNEDNEEQSPVEEKQEETKQVEQERIDQEQKQKEEQERQAAAEQQQRREYQQRRAEQARLARQAEQESMEALRKYQAEQAAEAAAKAQKPATKTHRQAEQESMEALRKYQAEQAAEAAAKAQKPATKTHRQAEQESMEKLEYQKKIEKILRDNRNAPSQDI